MKRPIVSGALGALVAAQIALVTSCQILVDGKLGDVHCQDEGAVGPPACPVGSQCRDGMCLPAELGAPCRRDADCSDGDLCLDPAVFGGSGTPSCSRPCCTSGDCDPDPRHVCWMAPDGAGSFCHAAADLGRAEGGAAGAGAKCESDGECRSGLCREARCADTCCSDTGCAAHGGVCRFALAGADDPGGFWCTEAPIEKRARYESCGAHADCASGLCIPLWPSGDKRCSVPCCSSASCEVYPSKDVPVACAPVLVESVWVRACSALVLGEASLSVGSACKEDGDCRSGQCLDGRCSDTCCSDESCGDPSSFVCRPAGDPAAWALRCAPE